MNIDNQWAFAKEFFENKDDGCFFGLHGCFHFGVFEVAAYETIFHISLNEFGLNVRIEAGDGLYSQTRSICFNKNIEESLRDCFEDIAINLGSIVSDLSHEIQSARNFKSRVKAPEQIEKSVLKDLVKQLSEAKLSESGPLLVRIVEIVEAL